MTATGMWTVSWIQQTQSGIPYRIGGVTVDLSQEYGPQAIFIHFQTQYEDEQIIPIAKDKAEIEARKGLDKILEWKPAKDSLINVKTQGKPESALMIVQPNDLTTDEYHLAGKSNQLKARLAWVVTYKVINPAMAGDGTISVYIDAKDGSFLSGYF